MWRTKHPEHPEEDAGSDDARLVDGLRRGAPAAFAGLHARYAVGIYNLALRVVRHGPDAEDITQDVLIRAFERLPRDREVRLRPWLYRLTLNRCYDYLRGTARRPLPVATSGDAPSPLDPYEQSELQCLLEAAIGDLTRRQRAALLLKDVHGLSLVEVAACLELTPGSVEVLLARARRAFRARFEERCVAAGRSLPRSSGGFAALPLLPLPAGLATPPAGFVAPAPCMSVPVVGPPLLATGGLGAALGLPASVKTAVLIAAAAATVGTAEIAATHSERRPPRAPAAALVSSAAAAPVASAAATLAPRSAATPVAPASATPTPAPDPAASPSPTAVAEPSPQGSPLGIVTPSATPDASSSPDPSPSPAPSPSPTAHATTEPSPSGSPTPTPEASWSPSPAPSASP